MTTLGSTMGEAASFSNPLPRDGLLADYRPPAGAFDEMVAPDGMLRPAWAQLIAGVNRSGAAGIAARYEQGKNLLRESGVTYSAIGAPQGPDRPWELDPLPLVFDKSSWQPLADALVQRATLLNLVLADVYGPQRLIREGVLPPALLFDNPGYLLPCHGIPLPSQAHLVLYAAHLARQPDGRWLVLTDRTQGPSGTGYTLENRIAVSRTLRHDFETLHIERLAPFFIELRERLVSLAPRQRENPRVVLLSPGVRSPTFFEDGYLSRYLGYTLVEGADLTVRGNTVYLKTIGGLLPVDVILRRIPDRDCDSLELEPNSPFGTAGLVQALRDGEVAVANAVGSGFLEAPVLAAFLRAACRLLLDEELRCASVPTWWCGEPESFGYVQAHFEQLIVRHALTRRGAPPIAVADLTRDQQRQLIQQIKARPDQFVAQQPVERSTVPAWNGQTIEPRRLELRTFAVAGRSGYQMMPGGLARVFDTRQSIGESMAAGQSSKDVWVLSDAPVEPVTLLKPSARLVELRRSTADVPSRVADNLFWLGRHAERAEALVRHLRSCVVRLTTDLEPTGISELVELVGALSDTPTSPLPRADDSTTLDSLRRQVIQWLFDGAQPGSLAATLRALHDTASQIRDRLSVDGWRIVSQMNLATLFPWPPQPARLGDLVLLLNQVLNLLAGLSGLGTESMTRGLGWRFLDIGRRVERALQTLQLFRRTLVIPSANTVPLLEAVLEVCDSSMTYRARYRSTLQLAPVLDLMLVDDSNPRAVGYQLNALSEHVAVLPTTAESSLRTSEQQIMLAAQATIRLTDVESLCQADSFEQRERLDAWLAELEEQLRRLSEELTHHYLVHTGPARQLRMVAAGRSDTFAADRLRR